MQISKRLVLGFMVLMALGVATAAKAYPYCGDITCYIPPRAYCSQECLYCDGETSGTEYPYPPYCDNPSVITVGQIGCPCYQASGPSLDPGQSLDFDKLLGLPALMGTEPPAGGEGPTPAAAAAEE
jgi:hypothetical protein